MTRKFNANLRIALRALRVNKLRSALTMLGVIIGVGAVIAMVGIGTGATKRIEEQIASIGSNVIIVLAGSTNSGGVRSGSGNAATLTEDDVKAIIAECPAVAAAAPSSRDMGTVIAGNANWSTTIQGTTPDYLTIRDYRVLDGRALTDQDGASAAKVALIGKTVSDNLFFGADPVGQTLRIKKTPFIIVGTLSPKGQSPSGTDQDDIVLIPLSTAKKKVLGSRYGSPQSIGAIMAQARGPQYMQQAQDQISELLRQRHRIQPGEDDDFNVRNLEELFSAQETSSRVMALLLATIASVSLVVGGIGIMNTMLISVTERTREIGLRQALGAKTRDILAQFLMEAVTLSVLGGTIGIAVGVTASALIAKFAGWVTHVSLGAVGIAFVFSGLVGVFFGYWPARKAAYMSPIDALRHE